MQELTKEKNEHTSTHAILSRFQTELDDAELQLREHKHRSTALQEENEYKLQQTTRELEVLTPSCLRPNLNSAVAGSSFEI